MIFQINHYIKCFDDLSCISRITCDEYKLVEWLLLFLEYIKKNKKTHTHKKTHRTYKTAGIVCCCFFQQVEFLERTQKNSVRLIYYFNAFQKCTQGKKKKLLFSFFFSFFFFNFFFRLDSGLTQNDQPKPEPQHAE